MPSISSLMLSVRLGNVFLTVFLGYVVYSLAIALYNVTLHPLARLPGPKSRGAFYIQRYWEVWTGDEASNWKRLHDRYGDTVRLSPSHVSFNNAEAWQEIYGQRQGKKPIPKHPEIYFTRKGDVPTITSSNDTDHSRMRRLLSHAFSEAALREQEPLLNVYFDMLIRKLYEKINSPSEGKVNMVRWFNFTTFDLIGDLCFGESFDALRTEEYNTWIATIFKGFKFVRLFKIMRAYPIIGYPILSLIALFPSLRKGMEQHLQYSRDKTSRRLDTQTDRRDFMSYILRHNDEKGMSREEIINTSGILIIAGSETTATLLDGAMFYLLTNPSVLEKLATEIVTAFPDTKDMTFAKLANLPYLDACLQEALRMYPPIPGLLARKTLPGGVVINGYFIPGGVSVGVHQWSAYQCASNFALPQKYVPERWLDHTESSPFAADKRGAFQPFSVGPRNCIGQHLAMAEMRAILARVLWHFDITLCDESKHWNQQKEFILWDKPDLMVKLKARNSIGDGKTFGGL